MSEQFDIPALKARLVQRTRQLYAQGAINLFEGNLSARAGGVVYITPSRADKETLTADMLVALDAQSGEVVGAGAGEAGAAGAAGVARGAGEAESEGGEGAAACGAAPAAKPSSEAAMHLALYEMRADIGAVVHTHSPFATAFALAGQPIAAELAELYLVFGGEIPVCPYGTPGTPAVFAQFRRHFVDERRDAVLLANHGLVCVGKTVTEAFARAETAEKLAKIIRFSRKLGAPVPLPEGEAQRLRARWLAERGCAPTTERAPQ